MHQNDIKKLNRFRKWGKVTVIATIFLIWVGGWVRSTGSGMGCPDWPKCFGLWIPPTAESQLPPNYLEQYVEMRKKKNERVSKIFDRIGMHDLSLAIKNDPQVSEHEPFNTYKTWTEYINRLIGVLVGFFVFLTLIFSIPLRKLDKRIFWLSMAGFVGVAFEGWLGSIVVSTNLMPSIITVHMVLAMLILVALIAAVLIAYTKQDVVSEEISVKPTTLVWSGVGILVLVLIQIILGTQVREGVDTISKTMGEANRADWLSNIGKVYSFHRYFYYIVTAAILYWTWTLRGSVYFKNRAIRSFSVVLLGVLISEILMGIGMHRMGIPPILQPLHLLFGTLLFAISFTVTGLLFYKKM
jgi:heme a synthase